MSASRTGRYSPQTELSISNGDYGHIFLVPEVSLNAAVTLVRYCFLSFSERNVLFPGAQRCFTCTCKAAWDAHVVLLHMHMSYCFTCTCKTTLHTETSYITLRDGALLISEKEINGNNGRHLAQNWTVLSVFHHSSTEYYLSDKTRINTERRLEDCSSLSYICFPLRKSAIICVSIKI